MKNKYNTSGKEVNIKRIQDFILEDVYKLREE